MNDNRPLMSWNSADVLRYEETIPLKIPGYAMLHEMAERLLAAVIRDDAADLLIVGAGGGREVATMGGKHDRWTFTGVDPSGPMLDIAEGRATRAGLGQRVVWVRGTIDRLPPDRRFDGAACLLVLHFVQGMERKRELLRGISERLKPGAPFVIASLNGEPQTGPFAVQMQAWKSHMLDNGIASEEWERFAASIGRESDPVSPDEAMSLLRETGFAQPARFFGSYLIEGYFARASASAAYRPTGRL